MKKILSLILCLTISISALMCCTVPVLAAENDLELPEFDFPDRSWPTFEQTGIPYDDIAAFFPQTLDVKYENGKLFLKYPYGTHVEFYDHVEYNYWFGNIEGEYWVFEVDEHLCNESGSFDIKGKNNWSACYSLEGDLLYAVIESNEFLTDYRFITIYPVDGYGEQYLTVHYMLCDDILVTDTYCEGNLDSQNMELWIDNDILIAADYNADGSIKYFQYYNHNDSSYISFIPGKGWSEDSYEYIPTEAPEGFEDATIESLKNILATDIGCEHQWESATCNKPNICAKCKRSTGKPLGHNLIAGKSHSTCSTCNSIVHTWKKYVMPSFENAPCYELISAGINIEHIKSYFPNNLEIKYKNGVFTAPDINEFEFKARSEELHHIDVVKNEGLNTFELEEKYIEKLSFVYTTYFTVENDYYYYQLEYDINGNMTYIMLSNITNSKDITISLKDNKVDVIYNIGNLKYSNNYKNGLLIGQTIRNEYEYVIVHYNSDLEISKVSVLLNSGLYYYTVDGWFNEDDEPVSTPENYEDKDAEYFAKKYPHSVDFCIHSFDDSQKGSIRKCTKCGEEIKLNIESNFDYWIVIVAVGIVLAGAAVVFILVQKKKKSNTSVQ